MLASRFFEKHPLLFLQIVGWSTYLVADWFDHISKGHYLFLPSCLSSVSAFVITGMVAYLTNRLEEKTKSVQIALFWLMILIAAVLWHKVWSIAHGNYDNYQQMFGNYLKVADYTISQWLTTGYYPLFLFLAWGGFFIGSKWFFAHREQQMLLSEAQIKAKQAQLQTLRYQLNPHFLFNVLNNIDVSVLSNDKATAHNMLKHLSSFLRNSLQQGEQDKVTVKEEISVINDFINIEQVRFGDALTISVAVDVACQQAMLPPMLLQPLVENAIKYAWSQASVGSVTIKADKLAHQLRIVIENTRATTIQDKTGTGTGLKNTQERLALVYGDDAQLITQEQHGYYQVTLLLPWEVAIS